jgi:serine phosphatase RsbU (regulator of sigma subunit)/pSer/pThr/pTyr-binding forkhead associated (FHA) protein
MRPPNPTLVILAPDGRRQSFELSRRPIRLGRSESCDYVLRNDAEVSREHAEIWLDESGFVVVEDKHSKNGTRVDGGEVLKGGRRRAYRSIRIGEHEIQVLGSPPPPHTPEPSVSFSSEPVGQLADTQFFPSSRKLDLNQQRLSLLMQLTERIGGVFDRKQLLEQALDACCEALKFERGLIALKTQRGDTELPVSRNVQRDESGAFRVSRSLINRALIEGERAIVNNPATDLAGNLSESLIRFPICSALCVPIMYRDEILGVVYGDRITQASVYQPEDVDFLAAIAQQVGVGLTNLRLFQERLDAQRVYAELEQARLIQRKLLPSRPLQIGRVRVAGYNEPSSTVSGDYFDFFDLEDGRIGLIIADVTGHGLPAALVMANLQSAVRVALSSEVSLPDLAGRLNRLICRNTDSHVFITAVIGTLDARTGALDYISAGHAAPLLLTPGRVSQLTDEKNSLPLGVDPNETFAVQRLEPAATLKGLLFYTDGVSEAADRDGALLGLRPVVNALSRLQHYPVDAVIETVRSVVREHLDGVPIQDDMTLLAVELP